METHSIFDAYQKKGLLPNLGGNDDIYNKLKQSSEDIADMLVDNPNKIIPFSLVAIDNQITEEEPVLQEIETKISANWQMVRSQFTEMPVVLYRAVVLQAIEILIHKNAKYAAVIWFTNSDVYRYLNIPHKEAIILKDFLHWIGDTAEFEALKQWTVGDQKTPVSIASFNLKLSKAAVKTEVKQLEEYLIGASGPSGADGQARPDPNPHWPNAAQNWSYQFAPKAAKGIATVIDTAFHQQSETIDKHTASIQKNVGEYLNVVGNNIEKALQAAIQSSLAVERRSQLLWWKETLYSRKLHTSYRHMSKFENAIAMAFDLFDLLPTVFPVSVDYILREAYGQIHGYSGNDVQLGDFFEELASGTHKYFLKHYYKQRVLAEGRTDLDSFIEKIIYTKVNVGVEASAALGVTCDKMLTYEDISVWLLHALAAKQLTK
ncbi:MAG: GTPase-associated system all-helical protein GASH [Chitinophagaceae bacterium]